MNRTSVQPRVAGAAVVVALLALAGAVAADEPTAWPDPPDLAVRLEVYEPFSPFERTVFEWKVRGRSPLLTMSRRHLAEQGSDGELTLISTERFVALLPGLDGCAVAEDGPAVPPPAEGDIRWAWVSIRDAAVTRTAVFVGGETDGCERVVRAPVEEALSFPPYRNPYLIEGEFGMLRTETDRPSRVWIDGVDTGEVTPLLDYPLTPGRHEVRWVGVADGRQRTETVTVEAGRTTTLNVTLEGLAPAGP